MFTSEEFDIMVDELLCGDGSSFDMLCAIAEKTLRRQVRRWCSDDIQLRGRMLEDDIMQEIQLRLIKTCKASFLLREGVEGGVNRDQEWFKRWMFKLAWNIKCDFANALRRVNAKVRGFDEGEEERVPAKDETLDITEERVEALARAFSIVINSRSQVYKILTWLAQSIMMLDLDVTKIKSNSMLLESFESRTLGEMYEMIRAAAGNIPWLVITPEEDEKIKKQLMREFGGGRRYYEIPYREFFMRKGGKATISDWVNRMNGLVNRAMCESAAKGRMMDDGTSD